MVRKNGNPVLVKLAIQQFGYFTFTFSACKSNRLDGGITWIVYSLQVLGNDRNILVATDHAICFYTLAAYNETPAWNTCFRHITDQEPKSICTHRRAARAEQCARYFWLWTSWTHQTNWLRMSRTAYTHKPTHHESIACGLRDQERDSMRCARVLERASGRDVAVHRGEVAARCRFGAGFGVR